MVLPYVQRYQQQNAPWQKTMSFTGNKSRTSNVVTHTLPLQLEFFFEPSQPVWESGQARQRPLDLCPWGLLGSQPGSQQ